LISELVIADDCPPQSDKGAHVETGQQIDIFAGEVRPLLPPPPPPKIPRFNP
jgi:hypothetical protein